MEPPVIAYRTTAVLPQDLALRRCVDTVESFDARKDAKSRSYEYRIVNAPVRSPLRRRRAIYVARKLDIDLLQKTGDGFADGADGVFGAARKAAAFVRLAMIRLMLRRVMASH